MISDDSGVKFFDRKFVAANLRSELRCPKCAREYSHKFTSGGSAGKKSFKIPFAFIPLFCFLEFCFALLLSKIRCSVAILAIFQLGLEIS